MISKSNFTAARQCYKRAWLSKYRKDLAEIDENTRARFDVGRMVGKAARNLFPGGSLVNLNRNQQAMADKTRSLIDSGCQIIYEAAFIFEDLIAVCDIVIVTPKGLQIYEVKSGTSAKDEYITDISYQNYVVSKSGYEVVQANLVHINTEYTRYGELDYEQLFKIVDVTENSEQSFEMIESEVPIVREMLNGNMPNISIGKYCKDPYKCEFYNACWEHVPDYSVFDLYRVSDKAYEYYSKGIVTLEDIHEKGILLRGVQKQQVDTLVSGEPVINKDEIHKFINSLQYPLYFLDFETFQEAIPSYDGCRAYEQIPFQYSLHIQNKPGEELIHKEFLGKEGTNPKRTLAEQIIKDIGLTGTVLAYNMSFEATVLKKLAEEFPDLADHLLIVANNLNDLLIPFRKTWYYCKEMKGSFSIKSTLPALYPPEMNPDLDYKKLGINNGTEAMAAFPKMATMTPEEVEETRKNLLKYCKLDTYAMVKVLEKLKEAVEQ